MPKSPKVAKPSTLAGALQAGGRKTKAKKDPNAPKKAMSAYMLWLNENRSKLAKPGMGVTDVAKAAGLEWGKMKDKTKWEKKAADDKLRYEREMASYKAGGSPKKGKKK